MTLLAGISKHRLLTTLSYLSFVLLLTISTFAQTFTGSITGTIIDENDKAISNAAVTLTSLSTGQTKTAQTNEYGYYSFQSLQPGDYKLSASFSNFTVAEANAQLSVAQSLDVDMRLTAVRVGEAVSISAGEDQVAVETQHAELSNLVNPRQITELPLITRNPYDLVSLSSGAAEGPDRNTLTQRGAGFAINGQRTQSGNFLLDGGENNETFFAEVGQKVPLDSILEYRVQTHNYSSEFGRGAGFVANVVTKSGTNDFHGTLYEFNRNSKLSAEDFSDKAKGIEKFAFNRNQFGFSLGGPVIKNRTFFFGSSEWLRVRSYKNEDFFVPTPQLLSASSSATRAIFNSYPTPTITGRTLRAADFSLSNLTAADGTALPADTPLFGRVISRVPSDAGAGIPQNTFLLTGRLDHTINERMAITGRYALEREDRLGGTLSISPYQAFNTSEQKRNNNFLVQLTRTWSPNIVSESRAVFNRLNNPKPLGDAPIMPAFFIQSLTFSQADGDLVLPGYFPTFRGAAIPDGGVQNIYQAYSGLTYQTGRHLFKFGGQLVHMRDNRIFGAFAGAFANFGSIQNFINGRISSFEIAIDPKGKYPGETIAPPFRAPSFTRHFHANEISWFAEDRYALTPRLTLNAGLRWEYFGVPHSPEHERALDSNFYLGQGNSYFEQIANGRFDLAMNQTGKLKDRFYAPDYNNFAPRIGIAYDPFGKGKTVVRAGYGIFYDRTFGNVLFNAMQNPPNYGVITLNNVTASLDQYATVAAALDGRPFPLTTSARALDQNMRTAYSNHWNVNVQHELANLFVASIGYVGSNGIHLYSVDNINRAGSGVLLGKAGRLNSGMGDVMYRSNSGKSTYHSMQARIDSRYIKSAGLQFSGSYTWSHAIDNISATFADSYLIRDVIGSSVAGFQDPFNPSGNKGDADFDIRHRFVSSFIWDIPGANRFENRVLKTALDGWAVSGIVSLRTGHPFTIFSNNSRTRPYVVGEAPQPLSELRPTSTPGVYDYIDLSKGLTTGPGQNGPFLANTLGRNIYRAPGYQQWNMGIFRNIRITEGTKVQLRGELFNVFNHANLFIDNGTNNFSANNQAVRVRKGGQDAEQHRNIQLAVKFIF
jgi:hypothetical protein